MRLPGTGEAPDSLGAQKCHNLPGHQRVSWSMIVAKEPNSTYPDCWSLKLQTYIEKEQIYKIAKDFSCHLYFGSSQNPPGHPQRQVYGRPRDALPDPHVRTRGREAHHGVSPGRPDPTIVDYLHATDKFECKDCDLNPQKRSSLITRVYP